MWQKIPVKPKVNVFFSLHHGLVTTDTRADWGKTGGPVGHQETGIRTMAAPPASSAAPNVIWRQNGLALAKMQMALCIFLFNIFTLPLSFQTAETARKQQLQPLGWHAADKFILDGHVSAICTRRRQGRSAILLSLPAESRASGSTTRRNECFVARRHS